MCKKCNKKFDRQPDDDNYLLLLSIEHNFLGLNLQILRLPPTVKKMTRIICFFFFLAICVRVCPPFGFFLHTRVSVNNVREIRMGRKKREKYQTKRRIVSHLRASGRVKSSNVKQGTGTMVNEKKKKIERTIGAQMPFRSHNKKVKLYESYVTTHHLSGEFGMKN